MKHLAVELEINIEVTELNNKQVSLIKGSDEHLDKLSSAKKDVSELTADLKALNLSLLVNIAKSRNVFLKDELLPMLHQLKVSSFAVLHYISIKDVYCDLTDTRDNYNTQVNRLSEIISDLENITLPESGELDELLRSLSKM